MAWLQNLQTGVTVVTGALAAWVGYQQFELNARVEAQRVEIARLNAQLEQQRVDLERQAEERIEEEQERRFNFDVFKLAVDSIRGSDPDLQRALVAYFGSLSEGPFRQQMLVLFRGASDDPRTAKSASRELGREGEALFVAEAPPAHTMPPKTMPAEAVPPAAAPPAAAPPSAVPTEPLVEGEASSGREAPLFGLLDAGDPDGWDYDLFVCLDALAGDPTGVQRDVEALAQDLRAFDGRHGRIQIEPLDPAALDARTALPQPGLVMLIDEGRAGEVEQGERLRRSLESAGFYFVPRANPGPVSPWYISLFYCPG